MPEPEDLYWEVELQVTRASYYWNASHDAIVSVYLWAPDSEAAIERAEDGHPGWRAITVEEVTP